MRLVCAAAAQLILVAYCASASADADAGASAGSKETGAASQSAETEALFDTPALPQLEMLHLQYNQLGGVLPSIRVVFVLQSVAFVVGGFLSCAFGLETSRRSLRDAV